MDGEIKIIEGDAPKSGSAIARFNRKTKTKKKSRSAFFAERLFLKMFHAKH